MQMAKALIWDSLGAHAHLQFKDNYLHATQKKGAEAPFCNNLG